MYEQLKLTGFEVTTQYPAYLKLPDRVEVVPSGELVVPAGSKVKLRILANTALTSGQITWQDGRQQAMTLENGETGSAVATFDVSQDTSYAYVISDGNGQKEKSRGGLLGAGLAGSAADAGDEVPADRGSGQSAGGDYVFRAEAVDDWAVAGVELVYQRQLPMVSANDAPQLTPPVRVPLTLTRAAVKEGGLGGISGCGAGDGAAGGWKICSRRRRPRRSFRITWNARIARGRRSIPRFR